MPREVELGRGVIVAPFSLINGADRKVDAGKATVFVVYPDDTSGAELDEIIRATAELARVEQDDKTREPQAAARREVIGGDILC